MINLTDTDILYDGWRNDVMTSFLNRYYCRFAGIAAIVDACWLKGGSRHDVMTSFLNKHKSESKLNICEIFPNSFFFLKMSFSFLYKNITYIYIYIYKKKMLLIYYIYISIYIYIYIYIYILPGSFLKPCADVRSTISTAKRRTASTRRNDVITRLRSHYTFRRWWKCALLLDDWRIIL